MDRCGANSKIVPGAKIGVLAKKLTTDPSRSSRVSGLRDSWRDPEDRVALLITPTASTGPKRKEERGCVSVGFTQLLTRTTCRA